jgi:hypothetical protein
MSVDYDMRRNSSLDTNVLDSASRKSLGKCLDPLRLQLTKTEISPKYAIGSVRCCGSETTAMACPIDVHTENAT